MRRRIPQGQLRTGRAVLLLEVTWAGSVYRFASEPTSVTDADGVKRRYVGGLAVERVSEELERGTISADDLAVPIEVWFPVDVVARVRSGWPLSMATAEISVVMVEGQPGATTTLQQYEDRFVLLRGEVSEPIIGDPRYSAHRAAFSVQSYPYDDGTPILDPRTRIRSTDYPASDGKMPPLVFGRPGVYLDEDGAEQVAPGSPAYVYTGASRPDHKAVICVGPVYTSQVTLTDGSDRSDLYTPELLATTGGYQSIVSEDSFKTPQFNDPPLWVSWNQIMPTSLEKRGARVNPFTGRDLVGLGDVLRVILNTSGTRIDHGAWEAAAGWLNRYSMAGYINDAKTTAWGWIAEHIAPLVPSLRVVRGIDGLVPVLYGTDRPVDALFSVSTGPGFRLASGEVEERSPADVVNDVTLEFAFDAQSEKPRRALRVGPEGVAGVDLVSPAATVSSRIYGHRVGKTIQSWYVYSDRAARAILTDYVARLSFIGSEIAIEAAPEWGWLDLGDEIALTSAELQLTDRRAVVVGRAWHVLSGSWEFTLWLSPDPLSSPPE